MSARPSRPPPSPRLATQRVQGKEHRPHLRRAGPDEGSVGRPLYFIKYFGAGGASFTIDSAREGIGDRNIMEISASEEATSTSPFGPMYLISKGSGIQRRADRPDR